MVEEIPRKVKEYLKEHNISGVVGGYTSKIGNALQPMQAAFTCWGKDGKVIVVLYKAAGTDWSDKPYQRTFN